MELVDFAKKLKESKSVLIFCHIRPDGDTLGCGLAICEALKQLNIKSEVICEEPVNERYMFIDGMKDVVTTPSMEFETHLAVDCGDDGRLGSLCPLFYKAKRTFNVDHHVSNTRYAEYNYVEGTASCCEIMYKLILKLGIKIDGRMANDLMLGIYTDTGAFAYQSVTSSTFYVASKLKEVGANSSLIDFNMLKRQSPQRAKLFIHTMDKMKLFLDDRLAIVHVTLEDLKKYDATLDMAEGFANFPLTIDGIEVVLSMLETKPHNFKISLRSTGKVNVNNIAKVYGGGGHILASGCMIGGYLEEVIDKMVYTVSQHM